MKANTKYINDFLPKIISVFILLLIAAFYLLNNTYYFFYYFDASWVSLKKWFPSFYFVMYLFFRLLIPSLLICWCFLFLSCFEVFKNHARLTIFFALLFGVSWFWLFANFGFNNAIRSVLQFCVVVQSVFLLYLMRYRIKISVVPNLIPFFFFFSYMAGCLYINSNFCPFYRFDMFDKMDANGFPVFILRDCNDSLLPYNKFFAIRESDIYNIYFRKQEADSIMGKKLFELIIKTKKTQLANCDSISINKLDITLNGGKIKQNEYCLYKSTM